MLSFKLFILQNGCVDFCFSLEFGHLSLVDISLLIPLRMLIISWENTLDKWGGSYSSSFDEDSARLGFSKGACAISSFPFFIVYWAQQLCWTLWIVWFKSVLFLSVMCWVFFYPAMSSSLKQATQGHNGSGLSSNLRACG